MRTGAATMPRRRARSRRCRSSWRHVSAASSRPGRLRPPATAPCSSSWTIRVITSSRRARAATRLSEFGPCRHHPCTHDFGTSIGPHLACGHEFPSHRGPSREKARLHGPFRVAERRDMNTYPHRVPLRRGARPVLARDVRAHGGARAALAASGGLRERRTHARRARPQPAPNARSARAGRSAR
jgi:hypothetical protein